MEPSLDDVTAVTRQVCESVLGTGAEHVAGAAVPVRADVTACIQITGAWHGVVVLSCGRAVADAVTAAMFGAYEGAAPQEDVIDAMGELANMIGGNIKGVLPGPSHLSLPTVAGGADVAPASRGAHAGVRALYALDAGVLGVQVLRDHVRHGSVR